MKYNFRLYEISQIILTYKYNKMKNIKLIKKEAKWYRIWKTFYSKKDSILAVIETNLILNNI